MLPTQQHIPLEYYYLLAAEDLESKYPPQVIEAFKEKGISLTEQSIANLREKRFFNPTEDLGAYFYAPFVEKPRALTIRDFLRNVSLLVLQNSIDVGIAIDVEDTARKVNDAVFIFFMRFPEKGDQAQIWLVSDDKASVSQFHSRMAQLTMEQRMSWVCDLISQISVIKGQNEEVLGLRKPTFLPFS